MRVNLINMKNMLTLLLIRAKERFIIILVLRHRREGGADKHRPENAVPLHLVHNYSLIGFLVANISPTIPSG